MSDIVLHLVVQKASGSLIPELLKFLRQHLRYIQLDKWSIIKIVFNTGI